VRFAVERYDCEVPSDQRARRLAAVGRSQLQTFVSDLWACDVIVRVASILMVLRNRFGAPFAKVLPVARKRDSRKPRHRRVEVRPRRVWVSRAIGCRTFPYKASRPYRSRGAWTRRELPGRPGRQLTGAGVCVAIWQTDSRRVLRYTNASPGVAWHT